jgi:acetyl-CoA C-acetyltransferase
MNPARQASINAGLPVGIPAYTVNRVCGSGTQAIVSAALEILAGYGNCAIAGGMESMAQAPYLIPNGRWGYRMGHGQIVDSILNDGLNDSFSGQHSGWHTEDLVTKFNISREAQDQWALRSQLRFSAAQAAGKFYDEIMPIELQERKEKVIFTKDETNRPDTTIDGLSRLKPAFRPNGTITAGNAPGLNSAASAMIIADRDFAESNGIQPWARIASFAISAVEPDMFGIGPIPAVKLAMERAGWTRTDVDRIEINEAFANVTMAAQKSLEIPAEKTNLHGGAIAIGHPIGASGARILTTLVHSLHTNNLRRGLATLCIGGGEAVSLIIEKN